MPIHLAAEEGGYWDRTTGALERVWDVSKKRFINAWNPGDPVGLDIQTRIEQRRPGGSFHGPVGFANEAISGPLIAVGDTILRTGNGLLHAGAFGANQVASELGLAGQRDRRLARDILGMAQISFGRVGRAPFVAGKAGQRASTLPKVGKHAAVGSSNPATRNTQTPGTALVPLHPIDRMSRLTGSVPGGKLTAKPFAGPDFIATRNGTAVHASQEEMRKSILGGGATSLGPTGQSREIGEIFIINTPDGPMGVRMMRGKPGARATSHFGPRTVTTKGANSKEYVYPNGVRIHHNNLSAADRRAIGHIHGQRRK